MLGAQLRNNLVTLLRPDKRLAPRRNTLLPALIVYGGGQLKTECFIRNLSSSGAKLELRGSVGAIPNSFDLIAAGHRPYACRVVWRSLKELGVQFTG
jgi:hypothetical protein